jgi:hypothetical protein
MSCDLASVFVILEEARNPLNELIVFIGTGQPLKDLPHPEE